LGNGLYITWYENGQVCFRGNYVDDKNDNVRMWYLNGNLFIELERDLNPSTRSEHMITYYASGEKWSESRSNKVERTVKDWLKDGRLVAEGTRRSGKWWDGTVLEYEYEIPIISKYSEGKLISTTDIDGKSVDVTKLRKKTEEELTQEGYGMQIGFHAEYK